MITAYHPDLEVRETAVSSTVSSRRVRQNSRTWPCFAIRAPLQPHNLSLRRLRTTCLRGHRSSILIGVPVSISAPLLFEYFHSLMDHGEKLVTGDLQMVRLHDRLVDFLDQHLPAHVFAERRLAF